MACLEKTKRQLTSQSPLHISIFNFDEGFTNSYNDNRAAGILLKIFKVHFPKIIAQFIIPPTSSYGWVSERFMVAVLKTAEARASVGSNPTPSASILEADFPSY